jgi:hypothetical protein
MCRCISVLLLVLMIAMAWAYAQPGAGSTAAELAPAAAGSVASAPFRVVDPAKVEGHSKCVDCHKSEVASWLASKHAGITYDELRTNPNSRDYASKLGISPARIARDSVCTHCHATPQKSGSGPMRALASVSCESCHGAAGGEQGWLNPHAVYGPPGTRRDQESPDHRRRRLAGCREAGQRRAGDIYLLAKSCFACHLVPDEEVAKTGHKTHSPSFEFMSWSLGEVRHNFHLNQQHNAEAPSLWAKETGTSAAQRRRVMYVVGQLVDIEMSLRSRAQATDPAFAAAAAVRVASAHGQLTNMNGLLALDEFQTVLDGVTAVFGNLFLPPLPEHQAEMEAAADQVADVAKKFADTNDGSRLGAIDALLPATVQGPVYHPK